MIDHPLSTLLMTGNHDVTIITTLQDRKASKSLLGNGRDLGVELAMASSRNLTASLCQSYRR